MTQMREFREYAVNGREKYYKVPAANTYRRNAGMEDSVQKWTLTIHEPTCRYAQKYEDGRTKQDHYRGDTGLHALAERGFGVARYSDAVWTGCKVCGTCHREPELQALAKVELERRAEARQKQREYDNAKEVLRQAIYQRDLAIKNAQEAFYAENFKARIDAAMAQVADVAGEEWAEEHPELAALIPEGDL
jgi:hypothetical protein